MTPVKCGKIIMKNKNDTSGFLKTVPLFNEFTDDDIANVLANSRTKKYKKGKLLFLVDDRAEYFYVIISGWIKLFRETRDGHESVIALLTTGDTFGKSVSFVDGKFPYSAQIIEDSEVLKIRAKFFRQMLEGDKRFDDIVRKLMHARFNEMNQLGLHAEHLALMTSSQRVGCFILRLCREENGSTTIQLPYDKSLVAGRLGMAAETFSRSLNQLNKIGVVSEGPVVTINNIEQLRSFVCNRCSATCEECPKAAHHDVL